MPKGFKAVRRQSDNKQQEYSLLTRLDTTNLPDMTRQEFKDDADINKLLHRFGANVPQKRVRYGEQDLDVDLQGAYAALADAKEAWREMPIKLREKYPTWTHMLEAIDAGTLNPEDYRPASPTTKPDASPAEPASSPATSDKNS